MSGATAPGAADVHADPAFVDGTRNVAAWDSHMGGPGTVAHAVLALADQYDSSRTNYVSGYTTAAMLAWVRAGFAPTNIALRNASYVGDASTTDANGVAWPGGGPGIGAMGYQPAVTFLAGWTSRQPAIGTGVY